MTRQQASSARWWYVVHALLQVSLMWLVFFGVLPWLLAAAEHYVGGNLTVTAPVRVGALVWFVFFSIIGLWSAVTMAWCGSGTTLPYAAPTHLVVAGPYRFVRNPMTLAGLAQGLGVGVWWGSPVICGGVLVGALFWYVVVRPREERELLDKFREDYQRYREHVHALLPLSVYRTNP